VARLARLGALAGAALWLAWIAAQPAAAAQPAVDRALSWLALVDRGAYAESWERAAPYFRRTVSRQRWVSDLQAARQPLGAVKSRRPAGVERRRSLPGAPDGDYALCLFETSFARKASGRELVTMLKTDSGWRVAGYYIR
jgi:hypothetical protein